MTYMIQAAALRMATMDGKKQRFLDDKAGPLPEDDGCYEGYLAEAREIIAAAIRSREANPPSS